MDDDSSDSTSQIFPLSAAICSTETVVNALPKVISGFSLRNNMLLFNGKPLKKKK